GPDPEGDVAALRCDLCEDRPAVDPAGAAAEGAPAPGSVYGAERTDALRAARIQPALPVVRRVGNGRPGLGADRVHEEPRPAAAGRHRGRVLPGGDRGSPSPQLAE